MSMFVGKKDANITVRLTEEEKHLLQEMGDRDDLSVGFIVRRMIRTGIRRQCKQCASLSDIRRRAVSA